MAQDDNATTATAEVAETTGSEPQFTPDQYKRLQRQLEAAKRRNVELAARQGEEVVTVRAALEEMRDMQSRLLDMVASSDETQRQAAETAKQSAAQKRQVAQETAKIQRRANSIAEEYEADWAEAPVEVKRTWDEGRHDEALGLWESSLRKEKPADIEALVEAKVNAKMRELGHVDTGESVAPLERQPSLEKTLAAKVPTNPVEMEKYRQSLLKAMGW